MTSFDFMFGIVLGQLLLRHGDNHSRTHETPHISAAEGQKVARMTLQTLQSLCIVTASNYASKGLKLGGTGCDS